MAFRTTDRYGGMDRHGDDADIPSLVDGLLEELETEQFEEPDNEHAEVAVSFGDWTLSVHVSGLLSLQDLSWIGPGGKLGRRIPPLCRWARTRKGVADMLAMLARGQVEQLRIKAGWVRREELPARKGGDFFRRGSQGTPNKALKRTAALLSGTVRRCPCRRRPLSLVVRRRGGG